MTITRLIPDQPLGGSGPAGRWRRWAIGVSVLLHGLALLGLLLLNRKPPPLDQGGPSYDLVFEGAGSSAVPTATDRGESQPRSDQTPDTAPAPEAPPDAQPPVAPAPMARAVPEDNLPGPPAPSPTAPPMPQDQPAPPPVPESPKTEPMPEQPPRPAQDTPPTSEPAVRLDVPPPPVPPQPLVPDLALPLPPPPPPPVAQPRPPAPPPAPRPRTAPPPGSFANPMDLSFNQVPRRGERQAPPRMGAAPGSAASRSMDFSLGAPKAGPNKSEAFFDARARNLGADWMAGVQQFWLRHRYYPRQAAENGEDGTVDLELTVDRTGRVLSAVVTSRSGSTWIDMAAIGTFRGAQLPPIPVELDAPYKTTLTINYLLIR